MAIGLWAAPAATAAPYTASSAVKINVMGEWAHPDDDTSIIGPCGVWHERYDTRCGIIMVTRGEGGGNATGTEIGPQLGLRRENEDRVAHYRSGTIDIFNIDSVDFFYNTSAPLTQFFWGNETLRRITRIIRMTQPDVYIGFTPSLNAGHGNHQQAGRYIWEGVKAAADPTMFPEQLTGPNALSTWQVKKIFSGGSTTGTGGTTTEADCTTGFIPAATNVDTVAGVWTGYASPYKWPAGNVQGQPAGSAKTWAQVAAEGSRAYPTQSRVMFNTLQAPGCSRFGMTDSYVPFEPNVSPDGSANPLAGKDDAILYGATKAAPNGLPLGTLEYLSFSRFFNTPGTPFQATLNLKAGGGALAAGTVALTLPAGWTADATSKPVAAIADGTSNTVQFTITPPNDAAVDAMYKIAARYTAGGKTGYTDDTVRLVSPAEGRYQRFGKWLEYDNWLQNTAPAALRVGRSAALGTIVMGETASFPVNVHNWSDTPQSGTVSLTLPGNFTATQTSLPYGPIAPGGDATVTFSVTNTDTTLPANQVSNITVTTTNSTRGPGAETVGMSILPKTTINQAPATPALDGVDSPGEYAGSLLDIGRIWEGGTNCPAAGFGTDCGTSGEVGGPTSTYARVAYRDDALFFFIRVRDEFQSYAVKPEECVAHWLADSVEILIDPRGRASENAMDTANTFKLGIFPFTNDPTGSNGNGVNGPCWSRDADNHQGFSTGPLAATVDDAPNAPGVQVYSSAKWVGNNDTGTSHAYEGGGYTLEVKIPMSVLPAAIDPNRVSLNITPYDNDNTAAAGTTTLRHIDNSARLAWSTFGSVQSDPYRWGRATLPGYTPPADRPTAYRTPNVSHPNLDGAASPQTIAQSARNGVPISGREPAPEARGLKINGATVSGTTVNLNVTAGAAGTARLYLYDVNPIDGNKSYTRVWNTSCNPATNPAPDYGLSACGAADGTTPPWAPDMMGAIKASRTVAVTAGTQTITLTGATAAQLSSGASLLVSFVNASNEVQAFDVPIKATSGDGTVGGTVPATLSLALDGPVTFGAFTPGLPKTYLAGTKATVTSTAGDALLSVSDTGPNPGYLVNGAFKLAEPLQARARNASNTGTAFNNVGSSLNLLMWNGPVSNDRVDLEFSQLIKANDPLRTGTYAKTLTFTLSTTQP
ncbi:alpha-galactosidase-like protein [Solirubrobacter pauli]|uniref:Alpha-galactosidase-like protein n=2 Tax=Solirubrobacter pauli TaxID=166793 RepID=A0A660L862_9ACTN|nr:alpha-galactosidase-like protein [Solirubrobacter pauli]